MTRTKLEHAIRAACDVADDTEVWVFGSQSILGQFPNAPQALRQSAEADIAPRNHPERAERIDGAIGGGRRPGEAVHSPRSMTRHLSTDTVFLVSPARFEHGRDLYARYMLQPRGFVGRPCELRKAIALWQNGNPPNERGKLSRRLVTAGSGWSMQIRPGCPASG